MKAELIVEHIKQLWEENPLPYIHTEGMTPASIKGIQQQLDAGNKMVLYMVVENGMNIIKTIKVDE